MEMYSASKSSYCLTFLMLLVLLTYTVVSSTKLDTLTSYEEAYQLGMDAYKKEKWSQCVSFFKHAIQDYHNYWKNVIDCRLMCKNSEANLSSFSMLEVFHGLLLQSDCLRRCNKKKLGTRAEVEIPLALTRKFVDRIPYHFMQFCYYKDGRIMEAASAAFTYYVTHQDDEVIVENLHYYRQQDDITAAAFHDLERRPYQTHYVQGLSAYNEGDWELAALALEKSLSHYYLEEERCRAGCENGFVHTGFPDFINAVADHYVTVLACQQQCLTRLSMFGMENLENFVAEHYNYLQYSYYQAGHLKKAFESIASYLLFKPTDEAMLSNKQYHLENVESTPEDFQPSQAALDYWTMWQAIEQSLNFIRATYILPNDNLVDKTSMSSGPTDDGETKPDDGQSSRRDRVARFEPLGLRLAAESVQLKGRDRFMAQGFMREDHCAAVADLAKSVKPNIYGIKEISLIDIMELVDDDEGLKLLLRLVVRSADISKSFLSSYYQLSGLELDNVKVICMDPGMKPDADLPDDCVLQENGKCYDSSLPSDQYTLVAYLTDMEDGTGQFYFLDKKDNVQSKLVPQCGMIVGFTGDSHHGTNQPWKTERCALVMTLNSAGIPNRDLEEAREYLKNFEADKLKEFTTDENVDILNQFYDQGVSVVQSGEELLGPERVVADGLATSEECEQLITLAQSKGRLGDGYKGHKRSPHTPHELFTGLSVRVVNKLGKLEGDGYLDNKRDSRTVTKFATPYSPHEHFAGLNVTRSLKLVEGGEIAAEILQLFLDVSEHGRLLTETYFNLTKPLYFDYTHLVCRTAIEGEEVEGARDLSHPVHADNCMIQDDGSCMQDPLAYVQRHYSAILYLNGDFEGGQFFFAHKNKSEQISVQPMCGRLVAFNAGEFHGVRAVTKGQRCAIAMWYTHNPDYEEASRVHAARALNTLTSKQHAESSKEHAKKDISEKLDLSTEPNQQDKIDLDNVAQNKGRASKAAQNIKELSDSADIESSNLKVDELVKDSNTDKGEFNDLELNRIPKPDSISEIVDESDKLTLAKTLVLSETIDEVKDFDETDDDSDDYDDDGDYDDDDYHDEL